MMESFAGLVLTEVGWRVSENDKEAVRLGRMPIPKPGGKYMRRHPMNKLTKSPKSKLLAGLVGVACGFAALSASAGTISGSKHDLRGWLTITEICVVCHTPHNAQAVTDAPLWNHEVTTATFTLYNSPSFDGSATITQPSGHSKLCLSCHDGTVAIDAYGANVGNGTPGGELPPTSVVNFGTDLSNDHPVSFVYDAVADGGLVDPTTTITVGSGGDALTGTITDLLLPDSGQVQCTSCHDVHNVRAVDGTKLLRVSNAGSALCLTCHDK